MKVGLFYFSKCPRKTFQRNANILSVQTICLCMQSSTSSTINYERSQEYFLQIVPAKARHLVTLLINSYFHPTAFNKTSLQTTN
jgi:hypothetical protein